MIHMKLELIIYLKTILKLSVLLLMKPQINNDGQQ